MVGLNMSPCRVEDVEDRMGDVEHRRRCHQGEPKPAREYGPGQRQPASEVGATDVADEMDIVGAEIGRPGDGLVPVERSSSCR